ncbi:hypothetical protein ASPBRDRAFT_41999 [Aspergillus brasiliensis CBS 101740]|uniref:Nucleoside phosphorylase domain-containing protein n=1 Tax=Aspergillus brasiliensis (strain CBS 101740 / IMI 381727 / IBT 21946) TaxID=767769 RepID=A0A1L9UL40_ASPBC|nr:hypothetical protein ASPBRDRAFT_41999 [Aspergillus brasiliensis CBS 101740]
MTVVTRPPRDRHGFKIAIICALPREADAVIALFDHHWEDTKEVCSKAPGDPNAYTTGVIGAHNVVVAHMPYMGKVSAAGVAMGLRTSFPSIELALVVGICGGVPSDPNRQRDIFLGDVILSQAVVEYDFGRQYPSGFQPKHAQSEGAGGGVPPLSIQSILRKLETDHHHQRLEEEANTWLQTLQHQSKYQYPGGESDRLYKSSYLHRHRDSSTCSECSDENICPDAIKASCSDLGCDEDSLVRRKRALTCPQSPERLGRTESGLSPAIHLGRMGSGSTVMKSGKHRDEVAEREGIIGLEMEGAGVCSFFPSIVIKGVCDYADSHKNKLWQDYAAATAAACTKAFLQHWAADAIDATVDVAADSGSRSTAVFMMDIRRDDKFVGREEVMGTLQDQLKTQNRFALVGLGGMGKTRIAVEYALQFQNSDVSVFWIHASTKVRFLQAYDKIAQKVSIFGYKASDRDSAYMVTEWFESDASRRWLIVLDNADDHSMWYGSDRLADLLPRSGNGSILLTTRDKRVGLDFAGSLSRLVLLDRLDTHHGQDLLASKVESQQDPDAAKELIEELSGVPLAIVQAAAFMQHNGIDANEYLQMYRESPQWKMDLLSEDFEDGIRDSGSNKNPIATTWFISFEFIDRTFPIAGEILRRMSLLESQAIPIFLIVESDKLSPDLVKALGTLRAFSLITPRAPRTGTLSKADARYDMHRLVRLAMHKWLGQNDQLEKWTATTLKIVSKKFPNFDDLGWRVADSCIACMPHAVSLLQSDVIQCRGGNEIPPPFISQKGLQGHAPENVPCGNCAASLMQSLMRTCSTSQRLDDAVRWSIQAFKLREWIFGMQQECTIQAMIEAAAALYSKNEITEAKELGSRALEHLDKIHPSPALEAYKYEVIGFLQVETGTMVGVHEYFLQALQTRLGIFPSDHPLVLASKSLLAMSYIWEGLYAEAETVLKETLSAYEEAYGPTSSPAITDKLNLSWLYRVSGRLEDALALNAELSKAHPGGDKHQKPDEILAMVHSGGLLQDLGRPAAAVDVFHKALELMQESQTPGSPMEIDAITGLSQALVTLDRYAEAEPLLVQLLKSYIRQAGDQEITVAAMRRLAEFYEEWDMCLAAQPLRTKVAQINQSRLGRESVLVCLSQYELGLNLVKQGRHAEARPYLYTNLEYPFEAEDANHRNNLDRMINIANELAECGIDRCEYLHVAEHMARDAVRLVTPRVKTLPYVAQSGFRTLGFVYRLLGKVAEAEEQYQEALNILSGRSHMEWRESQVMVRWSSVLLQQGRYSVALSMATEAVGKIQGQAEPRKDTLSRCRTNLALAYMEMGRYRSASSLVVDILSKEYEDVWDVERTTVFSLLGTVAIIEDIATILSRAKCWQQSQHIYEKTQSILAQLLGTMDMRTLRTSLRLRDTLNLQGKFMDALVLSLDCKDRYLQRVRQDTVPERMMMAQLDIGLARAYEGLGDHTTAEALSRQALKTITESTDENSPESLRASAVLASILVSQGGPKLMKGSAMQRRAVETWATLTGENSLPALEAIEAVARTCEIQGDKEQLKVWTEKASLVKETFEESLSEEEEDRIEYLVGQLFEKWTENGENVLQEIDRRRTKVFTMMLP